MVRARAFFGEKNDLYIRHAFDLSLRVTTAALEHALLAPTQVDHVIFVSTTGLATPSLDAAHAPLPKPTPNHLKNLESHLTEQLRCLTVAAL